MRKQNHRLPAAILLVGFLEALAGCNIAGDDPDYRIEFTIEETEYVFTQAYNDPADVAEGCVYSSGSKTRLVADNAADNSKNVTMSFAGTDTGSYADPPTQISFSTNVMGTSGLGHNSMTSTSFNLTATEYGPVGGCICGTFSGQVEDMDSSDVYTVSQGYFCVKRKADDSITFE